MPEKKETVYAVTLLMPREPLGVPVWKSFLNLRVTVLRYRMRPVPVVFLRLAFSLQLSVISCQLYVTVVTQQLPLRSCNLPC